MLGREKGEQAMPFLSTGMSDAKVGKKIGASRQSVHAFRKKPETQAALAEMRRLRNKRIAEMGANLCFRAVKELGKGLKSPDESHRRGCANDLLGKFGFPTGTKHEGAVEVTGAVKLDASKLSDELLDRLLAGGTVDVATGDGESQTGHVAPLATEGD